MPHPSQVGLEALANVIHVDSNSLTFRCMTCYLGMNHHTGPLPPTQLTIQGTNLADSFRKTERINNWHLSVMAELYISAFDSIVIRYRCK